MGRAASGRRVLRLNVREVRLVLNPRPSFGAPIAAEGQCNGSLSIFEPQLGTQLFEQAMASISTSASFGNLETSTVDLAGGLFGKYLL